MAWGRAPAALGRICFSKLTLVARARSPRSRALGWLLAVLTAPVALTLPFLVVRARAPPPCAPRRDAQA
jgi:hypothetical protein